MTELKTLKDLETIDLSVPRILTPENGVEQDHSKGEPKILDEKYCLHVYSENLRQAARELILSWDKERLKRYHKHKRNSMRWIREYSKGQHQGDLNVSELLMHQAGQYDIITLAKIELLNNFLNLEEEDAKEKEKESR